MTGEVKIFDHQHCPYCNADFDVALDYFYDKGRKYRHSQYLFRCHACGTAYELVPIIAGFHARLLERGEPVKSLEKDVFSFLEDRAQRIEKARHKH